jgi:hypothetical protein
MLRDATGPLLFAAALLVTAGLPASRASAQGARYDYWTAIDRLWKEIGGVGNVSNATPTQRATLALRLRDRGQFFRDLYEYERVVVRDHALHRDSVGKHGGPAIPAAQFFLGRALQELGMAKEADAAYSAASVSPEPIRSLAAEWKATLTPSGERSWKRDVVNWRDGKPVTPAACPPATPACVLFEALLKDDATAIISAQRELMQDPKPDYRETIRTSAEAYPVDFFDPLPICLLAAADYALAAQVLKGLKNVTGSEAVRGFSLFRSGKRKEAEPVLRGAIPATGVPVTRESVSLGELLYLTGKIAEAEKFWPAGAGLANNLVLDARSNVTAGTSPLFRQGVLRQYAADSSRGWVGMKEGRAGGDFLARALLRENRPREALNVLEAVRPPSFGTDLNNVSPEVLVLSSRAHYALGRRESLPEHFPFARGDLAALAADFPVVAPILKLLQLITAPPNIATMRSSH